MMTGGMRSREDLYSIKAEPVDRAVYKRVKQRFDSIAKPLDGLGDFETLVADIAAIQGSSEVRTEKRAAVIFIADNGVVEEGVSQSGKDVTLSVARALGSGISTACTLGKSCGVDIIPVDIGIDSDEKAEGVRDLRVRRGTADFIYAPAMSEEEVIKAVDTGIRLAEELKKKGYDMLSAGEMGIGNTTTSTAVLSALLQTDSDLIAGRGAGLNDAAFLRKKEVIKKALKLHDTALIKDPKERAFTILKNMGGLDIAGITGLVIGGALMRMPVILDGLITSVSALLAESFVPGVREYLIPSHRGREEGNMKALEALSLKPYINGNMALGEGTGAIMLFPLIDTAVSFYRNAVGFDDYRIEKYERYSG